MNCGREICRARSEGPITEPVLVHFGVQCVGMLERTVNHWGRATRGVRRGKEAEGE